MGTPQDPQPGDMHIDATSIALRPVVNEDVNRLAKLRDGADKAMENVLLLSPSQIAQAGLNPSDVEHLRSCIADFHNVTKFLEASERMTDKLDQTAQSLGDEIAGLFGEIASQARRRAQRSPDRGAILEALRDLLDYQFGPAKKAVATRERGKNGQTKPEEPPPPPVS